MRREMTCEGTDLPAEFAPGPAWDAADELPARGECEPGERSMSAYAILK